MKILVAEDDRVSRRILDKYLNSWGYEVTMTEDGDQAWDLLQNQDFQIAILDWMMPGMNGIELCRNFRSKMTFKNLYILLLTGRNQKEDMIAGLEAGADDYVVKPFDPLELSSRLKVGRRLVLASMLLKKKNEELGRFAMEMETLARERADMLIHADRLASLVILTAGVAHEINNPSTFISGNVQTLEHCWPVIERALEREIEADVGQEKKIRMIIDEFPKMMSGVRNGVKRITNIVNGLKSFARVGKSATDEFHIEEVVAQALLLCSNRFKYGIEVTKTFEDNIPMISGDAQKLEQVFVNLLVNAADAIESSHKSKGEGSLDIRARSENHCVEVMIADNGPGIPEDKLLDIWKPFFTTKAIGKGTGLGLSISQGIVHDHGGEIQVSNRAEGGAVFRIRIPVGVTI